MIELRNITYHVKDEAGEKDVLDNVSLTLDGHFVALTGPNGGGKSTLAKVIAGIIRPTAGKVLWNGEDITDLSVTERARKGISYAFQQPVRFKGLTVKDLLSIAAGKNATLATACEFFGSGALRTRLSRSRSECFSFGRRTQTHRNRYDSGARNETFAFRRARSGNRPVEFFEPYQCV